MSTEQESARADTASGYEVRWQPHNVKRQTMILQAALELLEEDADRSMQQVAKRAGLAKSVVYRQFDGRDDLDRRLRSHLINDFAATITTNLDISSGSIEEILHRTIDSVAEWLSEHPRQGEFARTGPTHDAPGIDAVTNLKLRVSQQARELLATLGLAIGIDAAQFSSVPFAVVTMVEGTLREWVRDPAPEKSRAEIVGDLALYSWYVLDGAVRSAGLVIDPRQELIAVVAQLSTGQS
ncbi:TetR/AcrR family transcriptional regulator [Tomitella biformata]|uniref:TetR/AcrR family transcriptional regulator n=1 Tax=Tomitella biformata TaxID=630403 RepID=UPI000463EBA1|nr:TetR/AcrR family transcriptional regulator [Tomitella biformata]